MSDKIDYSAVNVPRDKSPEEYTYVERRAELLHMMIAAGHPDAMRRSQRELASRYGVVQSTICRDLKRLRAHVRSQLGDDYRVVTELVYRKAIREYVERGEYLKAIRALESWNDWLHQEGARRREPEEVTIDLDPSTAYIRAVRAAND